MEKIRIVYNKKTSEIIPHCFNTDGTVFILSTRTDFDVDDIIVSMIDTSRIDFEHKTILKEGECVKEEENS